MFFSATNATPHTKCIVPELDGYSFIRLSFVRSSETFSMTEARFQTIVQHHHQPSSPLAAQRSQWNRPALQDVDNDNIAAARDGRLASRERFRGAKNRCGSKLLDWIYWDGVPGVPKRVPQISLDCSSCELFSPKDRDSVVTNSTPQDDDQLELCHLPGSVGLKLIEARVLSISYITVICRLMAVINYDYSSRELLASWEEEKLITIGIKSTSPRRLVELIMILWQVIQRGIRRVLLGNPFSQFGGREVSISGW